MAISVFPIFEDFVAEIGDIDLSQVQTDDVIEAVREAFGRYAVLVFPDQVLTEAQHLRFAEWFGPLETTIGSFRDQTQLRTSDKIADVSNLDTQDEIWGADSRQRMFQLANRLWHTDSSFRHVPSRASALYARAVAPVGGHTQFADMRAAFDALPSERQDLLRPMVARHAIAHSRAKLGFDDFSETERLALPEVRQMLVRRLPETGRENLYLASHIGGIEGLDDAAAGALVNALTEHATQRQFVYSHRWRLHDLVIWDNRCTMHRGTPFDDLRWRRDVQRATIEDVGNTAELAASAG